MEPSFSIEWHIDRCYIKNCEQKPTHFYRYSYVKEDKRNIVEKIEDFIHGIKHELEYANKLFELCDEHSKERIRIADGNEISKKEYETFKH